MGWDIGGDPVPYLTLAFLLAMALNFVTYYKSDKIVLSMYKAKDADEREYPELYAMVRELTTLADMPMPRLAIVPSKNPNAFATRTKREQRCRGRDDGCHGRPRTGRAARRHRPRACPRPEQRPSREHPWRRSSPASSANLGQLDGDVVDRRQGPQQRRPWCHRASSCYLVFIPIAANVHPYGHLPRPANFGADRRGSEISGTPDMLARALMKLEYAATPPTHAGGKPVDGKPLYRQSVPWKCDNGTPVNASIHRQARGTPQRAFA